MNGHLICKECCEGKHVNCDGTAWSNELDTAAPCTCPDRAHAKAAPTAEYDAAEAAHEQYQDTDPNAPYYDGPDVPDALDPALCCHGCGAFQSRANIARAGYVKQPTPPGAGS